MELVTGGELFDQIIARIQFEEKDAATLICQVCCFIVALEKSYYYSFFLIDSII
jgi:hypothetical protein